MSSRALIATIPMFTERALCAELGPADALWFPDKRHTSNVKTAKSLCAQCPARAECLETALTIGPACAGIWGGMTDRQRSKLRTRRRRLQYVAATFGEELGA